MILLLPGVSSPEITKCVGLIETQQALTASFFFFWLSDVETTCSAQATETVFVTVFPAEPSIVSAVSSLSSTETHILSTSTILTVSGFPGVTVTTYEQSVPSATSTSSVGLPVSPSGK